MSSGGGSRLGWSSPLLLLAWLAPFAPTGRACLSLRLWVLGRTTTLPFGSGFTIGARFLWFLLLKCSRHRRFDKSLVPGRQCNRRKYGVLHYLGWPTAFLFRGISSRGIARRCSPLLVFAALGTASSPLRGSTGLTSSYKTRQEK
jgi:hypothetical protein